MVVQLKMCALATVFASMKSKLIFLREGFHSIHYNSLDPPLCSNAIKIQVYCYC